MSIHKDRFEPLSASEKEFQEQPRVSDTFIGQLRLMVARTPRVGKLIASKGFGDSKKNEIVDEIVQEILVRILSSPSLLEIEENFLLSRIRKIELPQLLNEYLRKELPERFRISKRIWKIIKKSERFAVIRSDSSQTSYDASAFIGLREWNELKEPRSDFISKDVCQITKRESRNVGRYDGSQLIITNSQLENYLIQILESADGHLPLARLRGIALAGINLCDPDFESLDGLELKTGTSTRNASTENPHDELIRKEQLDSLPDKEREFLRKLKDSCGRNEARFRRVIGVLYLCVLSSPPMQKRNAAKILRISTSLVSREISLIREVCRSLELEDEELKFMLKERLEKSLEGFVP